MAESPAMKDDLNMECDCELDTWEKVEQLREAHPRTHDNVRGWVFRGQGDFDWCLEPSILRLFRQMGLCDPGRADQVARAVEAEEAGVRAFQIDS